MAMSKQQYDMKMLGTMQGINKNLGSIADSLAKLVNPQGADTVKGQVKDIPQGEPGYEDPKRQAAYVFADVVEDWLDSMDITIPCEPDEEEDRMSTENAARIYGVRYFDLVDRIMSVMEE